MARADPLLSKAHLRNCTHHFVHKALAKNPVLWPPILQGRLENAVLIWTAICLIKSFYYIRTHQTLGDNVASALVWLLKHAQYVIQQRKETNFGRENRGKYEGRDSTLIREAFREELSLIR